MAIQWNKETWYSSLLTAIAFAATFVIALNLGLIAGQIYFQQPIIYWTISHAASAK